MKRSWLCTVGILALVLALPYYAYQLLLQDYAQSNINYRGRAYSNATQLAFGLTPYLSSYHKYTLPKDFLQQCKAKDLAAQIPCQLLYTHSSSFYKNCAWWRFEKCAHVAADPAFLNHPAAFSELEKVLQNPCSYLPSKEAVKTETVSKSQQVSINDYLSDRLILGCDSAQSKKITLKLSVPKNDETRLFVIDSSIGD